MSDKTIAEIVLKRFIQIQRFMSVRHLDQASDIETLSLGNIFSCVE